MTESVDYLLVLDSPQTAKDGGLAFRMARGILSVRELPAEGQQRILEAVRQFVEIQGFKNDRVTWKRMGDLLEETNPLILRTALQQFFKFRRGTTEQLLIVRPLFDHPDPGIREQAAKVAGVILDRHEESEIPEREARH